MSNFSSNSPGALRKDVKPQQKLASFFIKPGIRSQSEPGGPGSIRRVANQPRPDLMPQGRALNVGIKGKPPVPSSKFDIAKLAANENDERYQYLLKRAIIRRVQDEDKIIYAELPGLPGVLVVYRKPSERNTNPQRLNLDRRELSQMPLLQGEQRLRLLNFQHNYITKIQNLLSLPNLIFLDLYNNQIREISSLHTVPTLRVLMLGKNLIEKIKNLQSLTRLDVLDLHSNKIAKIESIGHLTELRVLNLANNQITVAQNLEGLASLTELNLRRNFIDLVKNFDQLPKLQRLFLSNNRLQKFDSIQCLSHCPLLAELALDGNGISAYPNYSSWVLKACPTLKLLDLKKITSEMRDQLVPNRPPQKPEPAPPRIDQPDVPPQNLIHVISQEWIAQIDRLSRRGLNAFRRRKQQPSESLVQSGHAQIQGQNLLFIYGNALQVLSKAEFQDKVEQIFSQYVRFDYVYQHSCIQKLRKFSRLKTLIFNNNNLHSFIQLSKLECLPNLTAITIENNDVAYTVLCRSFIVYRFPNLQLINGESVTQSDREKAKQQFQNFDKILCTPYIMKPHHDHDDRDAQKAYRLTTKKHSEFSQTYISNIMNYAINVQEKLQHLRENWDQHVESVVQKTTRELSIPSSISEATFRNLFDTVFQMDFSFGLVSKVRDTKIKLDSEI